MQNKPLIMASILDECEIFYSINGVNNYHHTNGIVRDARTAIQLKKWKSYEKETI